MKTTTFILFLFFSHVFGSCSAQQTKLKFLDSLKILELTLTDSTYELYGAYHLVCLGGNKYEEGSAKISEDKIVLDSNLPYDTTDLKKMVLKRREVQEPGHIYFIGEDESIWEVTYVENNAFENRLLRNRNKP